MLDPSNVAVDYRLFDITNMPNDTDPPIYAALMRVKPVHLSLSAWATRAGLARNIFNNIREHGNPKSDTLQKLLDAAEVGFPEWEAALSSGGDQIPPIRGSVVAEPYRAFRGHDRPRDVPVLGTPACGDVEMDGHHVETIEIDGVIDYVRRPQALDGRKDVYAIMPQGFSMIPKFEPGEIAYVESKPPRIGDYAVVQLRGSNGESVDRIVSALLKRLVRQQADWVELEQFNPALTFRVDRARIAKIDRVIRLEELVTF